MTTFFGHRTLVDLGPEWLERWGVAWEPGFTGEILWLIFATKNWGVLYQQKIGVNTVETYMNNILVILHVPRPERLRWYLSRDDQTKKFCPGLEENTVNCGWVCRPQKDSHGGGLCLTFCSRFNDHKTSGVMRRQLPYRTYSKKL